MRHALLYKPGDKVQKQKMKEEIESFISYAYQKEQEAELEDVYVTNHEPKQKKYHTTNKKEDEEFFRYKKSLEEYNKKVEPLPGTKKERYEKGSLLQRILDPLAGAEKQPNGALLYKFEDREIAKDIEEERLRREFEKLKQFNEEPLEASEDDENDLRIQILKEMEELSPFTEAEFHDILDKELSVFKKGEKYDYVKDIRNAFSSGLQKPTAQKILETIPDHAFWDIKVPRNAEAEELMNPYNPFRKYPVSSFFDIVEYQTYMDRRTRKNNIADGVSTYRRY